MNSSDPVTDLQQVRPDGMSATEWTQRLELAACYRLFDYLGWTEMIFNHITLRVDNADGPPAYLINPFGLHYAEVTATNLVKIDVNGRKLCDSPWPVNPAGFLIHSVVHRTRHDAGCVMHTHTTAGMAVACKKDGLRFDNFYSAAMYGRVGYHDFEGVTTDDDEAPRLAASLGDKEALILRNHGLLALGPHVPGALSTMWSLQRGCEIQMASDSMRGDNIPVATEILERIPAQRKPIMAGQAREGERMFQGMLRRAGIRYADLV